MKDNTHETTYGSAEFNAARALVDAAKKATERRHDNALELWRIAAEACRRLVGVSQTSIYAHAEYAQHLIVSGQYTQAQSMLMEQLEYSLSNNGRPDSLTICILQRLGVVMRKMGQHEKSAKYYIQAAEAAETIEKPICRTAQFCHSMAGRALIGARKHRQALAHLTKAKEISSVLDGCSVSVAYACRDLIVCHMRLKNWQEAFDLAEEARHLINESGVGRRQHLTLKCKLGHYWRRSSMRLKLILSKPAGGSPAPATRVV